MIPVYMSEEGEGPAYDGATGTGSDCLRASLASVLELGAEECPHFMSSPDTARVWPLALRDWLRERGLELHIKSPSCDLDETLAYMAEHHSDEFYLLAGRSGKDYGHVVVGRGGRVVHDPAPSVPRGSHGLAGPVPTCGRYVVMLTRPVASLYAALMGGGEDLAQHTRPR